MHRRIRLTIIVAFLCMILALPASADAAKRGLFVNLTSAELNRSMKAISMGISALRTDNTTVTIFLNVEGSLLAGKDQTQHVHGMLDKTPHQMLKEFISLGGRLMLCPMCMHNVGGMDEDDIIDGIIIASPEKVFADMFQDNTRVISY